MLTANKTARVTEANGFQKMFAPGRLTLGVFFPIEAFKGDQPTMRNQEHRRAEPRSWALPHSGFGTCRCVIPTSATSGRSMTPGSISAGLRRDATIALATGSIILPVRHPLHTAKAAASIDQLTGGRFVLGVASGDRPIEFPAFGIDPDDRDLLFRENLHVIREVLADEFPIVQSSYGSLFGTADLVPKPMADCRSW